MTSPAGPIQSDETRERKWTRRRVLYWVLGASATTAGGVWAVHQWREHTESQALAAQWTQKAAPLCLAGVPQAGAEVDQALRYSPDFAPALLLRTGLHLEAGRWDKASHYLNRPPLDGTPEAKLLLELIARRPSAPDWRHAFFDSWKAVGSPDFEKSDLLPAPLPFHLLVDDVTRNWKDADAPRQLVLAVLHPNYAIQTESEATWLRQQVESSDSVPLLMALLLQLIPPEADAHLRNIVLPAVRARLRQLSSPSPPSLQLALLSFLDERPPSALFQRSDLETLEKFLAIPEWKQTSNEALFSELRASLDGLVNAPGHHAWRLLNLAQATPLGFLLQERAQASKDHLSDDDQRWLGRLLWELGARIRKQRSHAEMDLGIRLQMTGSELTRFVPDKQEIVDRWVELGIWEKALRQSAYYRWPIASLQAESHALRARGEDVWMQAFAGVGTLP